MNNKVGEVRLEKTFAKAWCLLKIKHATVETRLVNKTVEMDLNTQLKTHISHKLFPLN